MCVTLKVTQVYRRWCGASRALSAIVKLLLLRFRRSRGAQNVVEDLQTNCLKLLQSHNAE